MVMESGEDDDESGADDYMWSTYLANRQSASWDVCQDVRTN